MKKLVLLALVSLLLSTAVVVSLVRSEDLPVHNIDSGKNYATIQEALDANETLNGHTIRVDAGTYYENVFVNKPLTIIGENRGTTIIDGGGIGQVIISNASDVEIKGFAVQNGGGLPLLDNGILVGRRGVRNTIRDCIIRNNVNGITLNGANASSIIGNIIVDNSEIGIQIKDSNNNDIHDNIIEGNVMGVWITTSFSTFNKLYHNNFISNENHTQSFGLNTTWDNGAEGNYWDDYIGEDRDGDGIGDTHYRFSFDVDRYPLMELWNLSKTFNIPFNGKNYAVTTFCNATVASFEFNQSLAQISFNVTGPSGTISFCNITIPNTLLWGGFTILVNGTSPTDLIPTSNATHSSFKFTIDFQSTSKVQIIATEVVPEFSTWTSILFVFVVLTVSIALYKRRPLKTQHS